MAVDTQFVRELFEAQWQRTVRLAGLLRASDPEDVAAEAFARLYARRSAVRAPSAAVSYLHLTDVNLVRDKARHSLRAERNTEAASTVSLLPELQDPSVSGAIRRLPDRQREAVVLKFWLDLSEREIAAAMSVSNGTVKTHLSRGLAALRPILEGIRDDDRV